MSANTNNKGIMGAVGGGTADRRRSSASSGKFAGLVSQKRNSTDVSSSARKASFAEQRAAPGFLGGWWHGFTKGTGNPDKK
ncbi:hypothetical protein MMC07_008988 [Pseudocyphellaria aurata]|nr:hypothetical protein [Pseudocyphellaria aurata]